MMAEVEADMAAQLAQLREMERSGELAAIPQTIFARVIGKSAGSPAIPFNC